MENYLNLYNMLRSELASLEKERDICETNFEISHNKFNDLIDRIDEIRNDMERCETKKEDFIWSKGDRYFNKFGYNALYTLLFIVLIVTFTTNLLGLNVLASLTYNVLALGLGTITALAIYPKLKKRATQKVKESDEYLNILESINYLEYKKKNLIAEQKDLYNECARLESSISEVKNQISNKHQELDDFIQAALGNAPENSLTCTHNKEELSKRNGKPLTKVRKKEIDTTN